MSGAREACIHAQGALRRLRATLVESKCPAFANRIDKLIEDIELHGLEQHGVDWDAVYEVFTGEKVKYEGRIRDISKRAVQRLKGGGPF